MLIKTQVSALFLLAVLNPINAVARTADGAPPASPNLCSTEICLEAAPLPQPDKHRFIVPTFSIRSEPSSYTLIISYEGIGSLEMSKVVIGSGRALAGQTLVKTRCQAGERCAGFVVNVLSLNGNLSPEDFKCQIRRIWIMDNSYRPISNAIAQSYSAMISLRMEGERCRAAP
jgi:hypothetical protein